MNWETEFKNPPVRNRIKPFWFWNGEITKEEIDEQLKEMADKGLGGAFICARQGLSIPYLSKEWFELTEYAARKAKELGLETWLYDEYPYPSGMSGGEVMLRHPEAEQMILEHKSFNVEAGKTLEENLGWARVLYAKAFPVRDGKVCFAQGIDLMDEVGLLQTEELYQITGLTQYNNKRFFSYGPEHILKAELPVGNWQVEVYQEKAMGDFKFYGNFFDPCCREAVQTFLETTHEKYYEKMGEEFGKSIYGMFSDEVGLLGAIPWSKRLPAYFKKEKGYDLLEHLAALHCDTYPNAYHIRYDLYDAAHHLFVESYHKQVADWCKSHHLEYTTEVPSMRMTTQINSTIVGGDTAHEKLGRPLEWIYDKYISGYRCNAKSISSMTRQLGQQFSMVESFHSVGWTMTLQDAKWMFDRLAASGINFYNVHAFYYTINSIVKHDAPPSQFLQNPYWKYYKKLADYTGRLGAWVTATEADIHVAVLDPAATLWVYLANPFHRYGYEGESNIEKVRCEELRDGWVEICKQLLFHQVDYEHLDPEMMEKAKIEDGEIRLGRASYRVLVIPSLPFLEKKAYEKIKEFAKAGGHVVSIGEIPGELVDTWGEKADWSDFSWEGANAHFAKEEQDEYCEWCRKMSGASFYIKTEEKLTKDVISSVRYEGEDYYVFLTNQGFHTGKVQIKPQLPGHFRVKELDLEKGEEKPLCAETISLEKEELQLSGFESRLLRFTKEVPGEIDEITGAEERKTQEREIEKKKTGEMETKAKELEVKSAMEPEKEAVSGTFLGTYESEKLSVILDTRGELTVSIEGKNIMRFDHFAMSLDGKEWKDVHTCTFIEQCAAAENLTAEHVQYQSNFGTPKKLSIKYPLTVTYRQSFLVEECPGEIGLLFDSGAVTEDWKLWINDKEADKTLVEKVRVNDKCNRLLDISNLVKEGENTITLEVVVTKDSDGVRDPLYLYGDFGVYKKENRIVLGKQAGKAAFGGHYTEGYPFYSGTLTFETVLDGTELLEKAKEKGQEDFTLTLDCGEQIHECLEVLINGRSLGIKVFAPYIFSGKCSMLHPGENKVTLCLTNTLAPMLDGSWFNYEKHCLEYFETNAEA